MFIDALADLKTGYIFNHRTQLNRIICVFFHIDLLKTILNPVHSSLKQASHKIVVFVFLCYCC